MSNGSIFLALLTLLVFVHQSPSIMSARTEQESSSFTSIEMYFQMIDVCKREENWLALAEWASQAIIECQKQKYFHDEILIREQLSSSYFYLGDFEKAAVQAEKSHRLSCKIGDNEGLITSLYLRSAAMRGLAEQAEKPEKKRDLFLVAKTLCEEAIGLCANLPEYALIKAKALFNLGAAKAEDPYAPDLLEALVAYQEALVIFEKFERHDDFQRAAIRCAKLYLLLGTLEQAKTLLDEINPHIRKERIMLHCEFLQAQVVKALGDTFLSEELALSAKKRAERLNAKQDLKRIENFLLTLDSHPLTLRHFKPIRHKLESRFAKTNVQGIWI